jgi:hypothetical protein
MGGSFEEYENSHDQYYRSLEKLKKLIPPRQRYQTVERAFLPNFLFNDSDLIVVIGQDGLVVNTAKYLEGQPICAINPDPSRMEGVLLPFQVDDFPDQLEVIEAGNHKIQTITLAQAELSNRQSILGVNDIYIGQKTHQSSRYTIRYHDVQEYQSSSGIIVSTGTGSTGWFKSIVTGAVGITNLFRDLYLDPPTEAEYRRPWDTDHLLFAVREPWASKNSQSSIILGHICEGEYLEIESNMAENGVIFSDGIESDFLEFNSGTIAKIGIADKKAHMIMK